MTGLPALTPEEAAAVLRWGRCQSMLSREQSQAKVDGIEKLVALSVSSGGSGEAPAGEHYAHVESTNIPVRRAWARCSCGWKGPEVRARSDAEAHARHHERSGEAPAGLTDLTDDQLAVLHEAALAAHYNHEWADVDFPEWEYLTEEQRQPYREQRSSVVDETVEAVLDALACLRGPGRTGTAAA